MASILISQTELAYLAGFIDGEGTITLNYRRDRDSFQPLISITNTDKMIIEWLANIFSGGGITEYNSTHTHSFKYENRKTLYVYQLGRQSEIVKLLESILPYLKVKKKRAELLLIYCKEHVPYSGEKRAVDKEIYEDIKELNRRGL